MSKRSHNFRSEVARRCRPWSVLAAPWLAAVALLTGACGTMVHDDIMKLGSSGTRPPLGPSIATESNSADESERSSVPAAAPKRQTQRPMDHGIVRGASPGSEIGETMTLDDAMDYALFHHPQLRVRQGEVDVARAKLVGASVLDNPSLVVDSDSSVTGSNDPTQITARLTFPIPTGPRRRWAVSAAEAAIHRAVIAVDEEAVAVLRDAADAAVEVLYLQERNQLQQNISAIAEEIAKDERSKAQSGLISEVESVISEVDAAVIEFDRLKRLSELEAAKLRLGKAIGIDPPRPITLEGKLAIDPVPRVDLDTLLAAARKSRPEIAGAEAAITANEYQLGLARAKARPDLQVGPTTHNDLGGKNPNHSAGVRAQIDVPIFNRNQGGISESAAAITVSHAKLALAQLDSLNDVASAYLQLEPIESNLEFYDRQVLPLAIRAEKALRESLKEQILDPVKLSIQLLQLSRIREDHLDLRYLHNKLRMKLEIFLGHSFDELTGQTGSTMLQPEPIEAVEMPEPAEAREPAKPMAPASDPFIDDVEDDL